MMEPSNRKPASMPVVNSDDQSTGLFGLMRDPWATTALVLQSMQAIFPRHLQTQQFDIEAFAKGIGASLAPPKTVYKNDRGVALIYVDGLLTAKANLLTRLRAATSAQWVMGQINSAIADPMVKSIILIIDSPAGAATCCMELARVVFDAAHKKPVVAYSNAVMLAGAYWVGSAANAVYVGGPTVQVGGLCVVAACNQDSADSLAKTELVAGRYEPIASPLAPLSAFTTAYTQDQANYFYSVCVNAVAAYRGVPPDVVNTRMGEGQVFSGQHAIDAGLVDGLMSIGVLVNAMVSKPAAFANRRKTAAKRAVTEPGRSAAFQTVPSSAEVTPVAPRLLSKVKLAEQGAAIRVAIAEKAKNMVTGLRARGLTR